MEGTTKSFFKSSTFYWAVFLTVAFIVGGFFYFETMKPEEVEWDLGQEVEKYYTESLPDGVTLELNDGKKIVTNKDAGYKIVISDKEYVYKDKYDDQDVHIQDFLEPKESYGGMPGCRVIISREDGSFNSIEEDVALECKNDTECIEYTVKSHMVNGEFWKEVIFYGEYIGSGLPEFKKQLSNNKLLSLYFQCDSEKFIDDVLTNLTIL